MSSNDGIDGVNAKRQRAEPDGSTQQRFQDYFDVPDIESLKQSGMTPGEILERISARQGTDSINWSILFDAFEWFTKDAEQEKETVRFMYKKIEENLSGEHHIQKKKSKPATPGGKVAVVITLWSFDSEPKPMIYLIDESEKTILTQIEDHLRKDEEDYDPNIKFLFEYLHGEFESLTKDEYYDMCDNPDGMIEWSKKFTPVDRFQCSGDIGRIMHFVVNFYA